MKDVIIKWSFDPIMAYLPILIISLSYVITVKYMSDNKIHIKYYWFTSFLFIYLIRSKDFFFQSMNPDEDQWLISANTLCHNPKLYFSYLIYSDLSRLFTILPLSIFGFFIDFVNYDNARLLNIALFNIFCVFSFKYLKNYFTRESSIFSISLVYISFGMSNVSDYIAYNSEMPTITLLILALLTFDHSRRIGSKILYFFAGILMVICVLAKEQIVLTCIGIIMTQSIYLIKNKNYNALIIYYTALFFTSIAIVLFAIIHSKYYLINIILSNMKTYSQIGLNINKDINLIDKFIYAFQLIFYNNTNFVLGITSIIGLKHSLKYLIKSKIEIFKFQNILFFIISILTVYITIKPGNYFFHYSIFYYIFFIWYVTVFFDLTKLANYKGVLFLTMCIIILIINTMLHDRRLFYPISEIKASDYIDKDNVMKIIEKNSSPGDNILIWGWENSYYIKSKTLRSCFYLYPIFVTNDYPMRKESLNLYKKDIYTSKPKIIVEAVGAKRFYFNDKRKHSIEAIDSELFDIINKLYNKIDTGENYTVYKLR